jgi:hypothetical protein
MFPMGNICPNAGRRSAGHHHAITKTKRRRSAKATTLIPNTRFIRKMARTASATKAQRAIDDARRKFPMICANGIFPFRIVGHTDRLSWAKRGHFAPVISHEINADEVVTAMEFLSQLDGTKTGRVDSYRLKHVAEDWGKRHDLAGYISNGALIVAALAIELVVEPCGPPWSDSPNVLIGVSEKSLKRLIFANDFVRRERRSKIAGCLI